MKWFKHDSTANMDAKLQEVLLDYGLEGYGLYWYCLELIAGKVEPGNLTFELEHDCRIIARNTGSTAQRVQEMMTRFVDLGLFENSQGTITCLKMAKVSDDYTAKLIRSEQSVKKPQVIKNKGVRQTPTNSEKVSLEENRTEENKTEENTSGTSADAPCSVCKGRGGDWDYAICPPEVFFECNHCNGTGKEPTCKQSLQVESMEPMPLEYAMVIDENFFEILADDKPDIRNSRTTELTGNAGELPGAAKSKNPDAGIDGRSSAPKDTNKPTRPKKPTKAQALFNLVRENRAQWPALNCVDDTLLTEWAKLRTRKGASCEQRALNTIENTLEELLTVHGIAPDTALAAQCDAGWATVKVEYLVKNRPNMSYAGKPQSTYDDSSDFRDIMGDML